MITPVPEQTEVYSLPTEQASPRGHLNGREIRTLAEIRGEASKVSSLFYVIAGLILLVGVAIGVSDRDWSTGSVAIVSGSIIGLLGSWAYKGILQVENSMKEAS